MHGRVPWNEHTHMDGDRRASAAIFEIEKARRLERERRKRRAEKEAKNAVSPTQGVSITKHER